MLFRSAPAPQAQGPVAGGPGGAAAVDPAAPSPQAPLPEIQLDSQGRPTKASMLAMLQGMDVNSRNQIILGAWMKAAGNKREFAVNLGNALLALSKKSLTDQGSFIVGQPFNVENADGSVSTWVQRRDGRMQDITDQLGGHKTTVSARDGFKAGDPEDEMLVGKMLDYEFDPNKIQSQNRRESLMAEANRRDPSYDPTATPLVMKAKDTFTRGKEGETNQALATAIGHLQQLQDLHKALKTHNMKTVNTIVQWFQHEFNDPRIKAFDVTNIVAADEVMKAIVRGVGSSVERTGMQSKLGSTLKIGRAHV